ncbi:hypothetical protein [uncultured Devosia sp.]|uniref:hypothetical protein n=1 Tax=uncultured Devosia sp. TaxID=211434 RepID=UPI0035CBA7AB
MARLVEEEENYWPGFVDALSTIVMVVTFLLIILGVVIFAISTQVSKALSEGTMISEQAIANQTSALTAELDDSKQQVAALTAARQQAAAQAAGAADALAASAAAQAAAEAETKRIAEAQQEAETKAAELAQQLARTTDAQTAAQAQAVTLAAQLQAKSAAEQAALAETATVAEQLETTSQVAAQQALQLAASAVSQQAAQQQADAATAALAAKSALAEAAETKAAAVAAQLDATTQTVAEQARNLTEQQQANQSLAHQAAATQAALDAAQAEAAAKTAALAETQQQLEQQVQAVAKLTETIATQNETAADAPTQDEAVTADNTMQVTSRPDFNATEIVVQAEEDAKEEKPVVVTAAREVLTVRFQSGSVDMSADADTQALQFVTANKTILSQRTISLWSFYDGNTLALTQAKRSAYFRLLAVRNALLEGQVAGASIDISVRVAETPEDVDTVKAFLQ